MVQQICKKNLQNSKVYNRIMASKDFLCQKHQQKLIIGFGLFFVLFSVF